MSSQDNRDVEGCQVGRIVIGAIVVVVTAFVAISLLAQVVLVLLEEWMCSRVGALALVSGVMACVSILIYRTTLRTPLNVLSNVASTIREITSTARACISLFCKLL